MKVMSDRWLKKFAKKHNLKIGYVNIHKDDVK